MAELKELARSAGVEIAGSVIQLRDQVDHRFLIGSGKLRDLAIQALQEGVDLLAQLQVGARDGIGVHDQLLRQGPDRGQFLTRAQARLAIFEYIEVFYNRQRRHSFLDHVSPLAFEQASLAA